MSPDTLAALEQQLCDLAARVAAFQRHELATFSKAAIEHKGLHDLVSYVDRQSEEQLVQGLQALLPEAGFITEEQTVSQASKPLMWIIDPLDGTTNFTHGLPFFAISVALYDRDAEALLLGVVYESNRSECFSAHAGGGARLNGQPIRVSAAQSLGESLLATGFPYYAFDKMPQYLDVLGHFMKETRGMRRLGSAALDLAYVACGRFEGYFEYNLNSYDVAAGALLVLEAGGFVSDFKGGKNYLFGREIVAATGAVHAAMVVETSKM
jgi:myo-inositol-1(or 4)-monophosphatase